MRRGEIFNLKWQNVDFEKSMIYVKQTKSGKSRSIPMIGPAQSVLEINRGERQPASVYVFTQTKNQAKRDKRPGRENSLSIDRAFNKALEDAGIVDFRFHDLRHSAGTRLADAGVSIVVIAEILGHSSLTTTKRYTHATDTAKREAMEKLAQHQTSGVTRK